MMESFHKSFLILRLTPLCGVRSGSAPCFAGLDILWQSW